MNPQNYPGQNVPRELLWGNVALALLAAQHYRPAALQAAGQAAAAALHQAAGAALMVMQAAGHRAAAAAQAAVQAARNAAPPAASALQSAVSALQPVAVGIYAVDRFLGVLDAVLAAQSQGRILPLPATKLGWARLLVSGGAALLLSLRVHAPEVQLHPAVAQALLNIQVGAGAGAAAAIGDPANHQQHQQPPHPWQLILAPGPLAAALANNHQQENGNPAQWQHPGLIFQPPLWSPPPPALILGGCTAAGVALAAAGRLWAQQLAGGEVAAGMAIAGQHLVRFSLPALAAAVGATEGYAATSPLLGLPTHTQWGAWAFLAALPLQLWALAGPVQRVRAWLQG